MWGLSFISFDIYSFGWTYMILRPETEVSTDFYEFVKSGFVKFIRVWTFNSFFGLWFNFIIWILLTNWWSCHLILLQRLLFRTFTQVCCFTDLFWSCRILPILLCRILKNFWRILHVEFCRILHVEFCRILEEFFT